MKNKRSAFEMSITTIVILVIAMIMLILGIMLVRKIMCGGMNIAEETLQGAKSQISKLFGEQTGEILCAGSVAGAVVTLVPGRTNAIACIYNPTEAKTTYTFTVTGATFKPKIGNPQSAMNWFVSTTNIETVAPESTGAGGVFVRIPKATPAGDLEINVTITSTPVDVPNPQTSTDYKTLTFEVRSLGFLRETAC